MYFEILSILTILFTCGSAVLKDGDIYRFTSVPDEHVITVVSTDAGVKITIEPWQDGSNQKWLAIQATLSDSYILLAKRQTWDWNKFVKSTTKDRKGSLPDSTLVMAEDVNLNSSSITQQEYNGRKYQQWKSVDVTRERVLIKNLDDDKCLFNPGQPIESAGVLTSIKHSVQGLIGKKKEKIRPHVYLVSKACNPADVNQLWVLSLVV